MELIIYTESYETPDTIENFKNFYYSLKMKYLASDLLKKGLSPKQITDAVSQAIKVANASGIKAYKHFMPVFSGMHQGVIQDCKLSKLAYGLVLMNADASLSVVSGFQVDVIRKYLDNYTMN